MIIINYHLGFAYPLDSQLAEPFDYHLHKMLQNGVLHQLQQKWGLATGSSIASGNLKQLK